MPDASGERAALAAAMETRRADLRIKWQDVARRADISIATLGRVRRGEGDLTTDTKYGLEDALKWTRGSVDATLAGGNPTLRESAPAPTRAAPPYEWSATARRLIIGMTSEEISELGRTIDNEQSRLRWMRDALRIKREAAAIEPETAPR
jgi:transcriptional regulator with XRE-family HTH domain